MADQGNNNINLAPKASHEDDDGDRGGGGDSFNIMNAAGLSSLTDMSLQASGSISPTNAIINGDTLNLNDLVGRQKRHTASSSPMTIPRGRTSSRDSSGHSVSVIGGSSAANNNNNNSNNPGGSADTRRRITKLSKAREREKVPRLVEYFCVVSSVPLNNNNNNNVGGGLGDSSNVGAPPPTVGSPKRLKNVTKVMPMPQTPNNNERSNSNTSSANNNNNNNTNNKIDGSEFQPQITARYPLQDHDDNPLLIDSVTAFCYPSGQIPIKTENTMPKVHYFVTTGESGQKMYGTCLTVWEGHEVTVDVVDEKVNKKKGSTANTLPRRNIGDKITTNKKKDSNNNDTTSQQQQKEVVYLPKCLVILSLHPYLVAFREYLVQLHRLSKMNPPPSIDDDGVDNNTNAEDSGNNNDGEEERIVTITTTSSSTLKSIMKQVLTLPVERYITNFCSELPAPPPGSFQVQTTILDSVISIWSPPYNLPLAWVSLPFSHLFQCLDVENVLKVWTALSLERQVLVTSTQLSLLTTCCEILLSLLFPMKWSHAYIPVLPHFLVPILSAPMPFLCGIDKRHLADTMEDLADECIVVDLDKNMVSVGTNTQPLPNLPKYIYTRLKNKIEGNVGHVHREVRSLRKDDNTSEMGIYLPPDVKSMADAMWESRLCLFDEAFMLMFTPEERRKNWLNGDNDGSNDPKAANLLMTLENKKQNTRTQSQWDAVQEAFLETYCFLLQKYRKYLVFPSKQNEGAYGGAGFRSQEFLAAQRGDVRDFLEEMVGSQMFDDFVTKRLYGSGEADISFFDSAVDRYVRNNGLVANVRGMVRETSSGGGGASSSSGVGGGTKKGDASRGNSLRKMFGGGRGGNGGVVGGRGGVGSPTNANNEKDPPMLQSARVKRELKTIVPPEPCGVDLPESVADTLQNAVVVHVTTKRDAIEEVLEEGGDNNDDVSITSASTAASNAKQTGQVYYHYPTFPEKLDPSLFGTPRPMSSAVRAEYDRQRENVGKFRRTNSSGKDDGSENTLASSARSAAVTGQTGPVVSYFRFIYLMLFSSSCTVC